MRSATQYIFSFQVSFEILIEKKLGLKDEILKKVFMRSYLK